jgi:hypothetical protein
MAVLGRRVQFVSAKRPCTDGFNGWSSHSGRCFSDGYLGMSSWIGSHCVAVSPFHASSGLPGHHRKP